jgi:ribosome-associated translation inhibitor RaiA
MQMLLSSPNLAAPTIETLRDYATKRFVKLSRFLPSISGEYKIKLHVRRNRYLFEVVLEILGPARLVVTTKDKDMRKAIDDAYASIKHMAVKKLQKARTRHL